MSRITYETLANGRVIRLTRCRNCDADIIIRPGTSGPPPKWCRICRPQKGKR